MRLTNRRNLPLPVVRAIAADPYSRRGSDISMTQLIDSPRIRVLEREADEDISEDVLEKIPSFIGQLGHMAIERLAGAHPDWVQERRLYTECDGWTISGQVDLLTNQEGEPVEVFDIKFVRAVKLKLTDGKDWERQLNGYAWLLRRQDPLIEVKKLSIIPIVIDWEERQALANPEYPQERAFVYPIRLWSAAEADEYFKERVRLHQEAERDLPECSHEERWVDDSWACLKVGDARDTLVSDRVYGKRRAVRVFSSEEEARQYARENPGLYVEHRKGRAMRCERYCPVRSVCKQWLSDTDRRALSPFTKEKAA